MSQPPAVNLPQPKPHLTLEDWKSWEGRWELIEGVAYDMTPSPNLKHQTILGNLYARLWTLLQDAKHKGGADSCQVFIAPFDVYLGESVVEPDLIVVCDPAKIKPHGIEGPPDLVVEVLSPSTGEKDQTRKRWLYETHGVKEYLMVHPVEQVAVLLRLTEGKYAEAARVEWGEALPLLDGQLSIPLL
jgi:Uma2 family endonuclease